MEIILKKNVEGLGDVDDLVTVKAGYGRNYLIPKGMAVVATASNKKIQEENLRQRAHKIAKQKEEAQSMADALGKLVLKVGAKAGENGKIFGSVTNLQIADALQKLGHNIDRKNIKISNEPIKELGKFEAKVKVLKDIETTLQFEVVEE
jgi:large subunit ribosomal protein L9